MNLAISGGGGGGVAVHSSLYLNGDHGLDLHQKTRERMCFEPLQSLLKQTR